MQYLLLKSTSEKEEKKCHYCKVRPEAGRIQGISGKILNI